MLTGLSINLWSNWRILTEVIPYLYKEYDRKYNRNTKIRKLNETDPDLAQDLTGKVCVITGGTRGLGAEVVKTLLRKNCHVITGSSADTTEREKRYKSLRAEVPEDKGKLQIWSLDLLNMDSVVSFALKFRETKLPLHYLIANAAIFLRPITLTTDGFEQHFCVNYLSHCLLIDKLIDNLYETGGQSGNESRIVLVSSSFHKASFIKFDDLMHQSIRVSQTFAYCQSKLALIMFAIRMSRWIEGKGQDWRRNITINSLHPGICDTTLLSHLPGIDNFIRPIASRAIRTLLGVEDLENTICEKYHFIVCRVVMGGLKIAKEGSETTIYATISSEMNGISGEYLEDCSVEMASNEALVVDDQNRLWEMTWKLLDKWKEHQWS